MAAPPVEGTKPTDNLFEDRGGDEDDSSASAAADGNPDAVAPVSYTHLTLPTILLV